MLLFNKHIMVIYLEQVASNKDRTLLPSLVESIVVPSICMVGNEHFIGNRASSSPKTLSSSHLKPEVLAMSIQER